MLSWVDEGGSMPIFQTAHYQVTELVDGPVVFTDYTLVAANRET
jgi:hypothetical protein